MKAKRFLACVVLGVLCGTVLIVLSNAYARDYHISLECAMMVVAAFAGAGVLVAMSFVWAVATLTAPQ